MLYEDRPAYGLLLKLIFIVMPLAMLIGSISLFSSGDSEGGLVLIIEAFIIGLIFWCVMPRSYQVYEDHIRIVLGGSFSMKVGFDRIEEVKVTVKAVFTMNFVTKFAIDSVVIFRKRGLNIAITPNDYATFVQNASHALSEWRKTQMYITGT